MGVALRREPSPAGGSRARQWLWRPACKGLHSCAVAAVQLPRRARRRLEWQERAGGRGERRSASARLEDEALGTSPPSSAAIAGGGAALLLSAGMSRRHVARALRVGRAMALNWRHGLGPSRCLLLCAGAWGGLRGSAVCGCSSCLVADAGVVSIDAMRCDHRGLIARGDRPYSESLGPDPGVAVGIWAK